MTSQSSRYTGVRGGIFRISPITSIYHFTINMVTKSSHSHLHVCLTVVTAIYIS